MLLPVPSEKPFTQPGTQAVSVFSLSASKMIPPLQNNMPVGTQDKVVFFLNICSHTKLGSTSVMTYSSVSDNKQWLKSRRCRTD